VNQFPEWWPEEIKERLRFSRLLTMSDLPPQQKGHCRWCGKPITAKGNRTWCSPPCRDEFLVRWNGQHITHAVKERDHGICAACGIPTIELERVRRSSRGFSFRSERRRDWGPWANSNGAFWEADHIVPVVEGGGCCGLDNYRTLCLKCHKAETAELARRRAEARKPVHQLALEIS
jgi:5-methylcytosine-specific restriction enzyme A